MALQTLNTIKQWFKTGLKPTQAQFWDTWDSFRHKFDKIPVKEVEGLDELLLSKADKTVLDHHLADKNAHAPQVNTDWNSESGFSQLLNKPEFKTINGESIVGSGDITGDGGSQNLQQVLDISNQTHDTDIILTSGGNPGFRKYIGTISSDAIRFTNDVDSTYGAFNSRQFILNDGNGDSSALVPEGLQHWYNGGTLNNFNYPIKPFGTYTLATLDDITGGSQTLNQVLDAGNEAIDKGILLKSTFGGYTQIYSGSTILKDGGNGMVTFTPNGFNFNQDNGSTALRFQPQDGVLNTYTTFRLPTDKPTGQYILATLDDITGRPQTIQQVLETGNTTNKGILFQFSPDADRKGFIDNFSVNFIADRYVDPTTSEFNANGVMVHKNNSAANATTMSLTADNVRFISSQENHEVNRFGIRHYTFTGLQTQVKYDTPTVDTNLIFPAKAVAGDYTIATLDDIPSSGSQTLDQVLATGNSAVDKEIIIIDSSWDGTSAYLDSRVLTMYASESRTSINSADIDVRNFNTQESITLDFEKFTHNYVIDGVNSYNERFILPKKTTHGNLFTLATTDDFKTINGESIVGEGDLVIGRGSQNLDQVLGVGNETTKSMSFNQEGYGNNVFINSNVIQVINDKENATQVANLGSSGVSIVTNNGQPEQTVSNMFSTHVQFTTNENGSHEVSNKGIRFYKGNGETRIEYNTPTVKTTLKFPAKAIAGDYTLATTDDLTGFAIDSNLVHKTGDENLGGIKTFKNLVNISGVSSGIRFPLASDYNGSPIPLLNNRGGYLTLYGSKGGGAANGLGVQFDTSLIGSSDKKVQFPDKDGVVAMISDLAGLTNDYLTLTGGTLSGSLSVSEFVRAIGEAPYYDFVNEVGWQVGYIQHDGENMLINSNNGNVIIVNDTEISGTISTTGVVSNYIANNALIVYNSMPNSSSLNTFGDSENVAGNTGFYSLESLKYNDTDGVQKIIYINGTNAGKLFVRVKTSGTWSTWTEK